MGVCVEGVVCLRALIKKKLLEAHNNLSCDMSLGT